VRETGKDREKMGKPERKSRIVVKEKSSRKVVEEWGKGSAHMNEPFALLVNGIVDQV